MNTKTNSMLDKERSMALRGVAILGIVLHNYCHFLGFAVKENEYTFNAARPAAFMEKLAAADPDLLIHFFSFLGHYGVPVFLFLSGYGLVKKYEQKQFNHIGAPSFCRYHFLKLFRLMIVGYVAFIAVYLLRHNNGASVFSWDHVLAQLTMTINLLYPRPDSVIMPGPYWFFGLMMQLYLIYVLVLRRWRHDVLLIAVALGSLLVEWLLKDNAEALNYVRYNFVGGLLPFCMGIGCGRQEWCFSRPVWVALLLLSAFSVIEGGRTFGGWLMVPAFVVTGAVSTVKLLPVRWMRPLVFMGTCSAALFVMHPIARELIISHYRRIDIYGGICIYLLSAVALALMLKEVLKYIPKPRL